MFLFILFFNCFFQFFQYLQEEESGSGEDYAQFDDFSYQAMNEQQNTNYQNLF